LPAAPSVVHPIHHDVAFCVEEGAGRMPPTLPAREGERGAPTSSRSFAGTRIPFDGGDSEPRSGLRSRRGQRFASPVLPMLASSLVPRFCSCAWLRAAIDHGSAAAKSHHEAEADFRLMCRGDERPQWPRFNANRCAPVVDSTDSVCVYRLRLRLVSDGPGSAADKEAGAADFPRHMSAKTLRTVPVLSDRKSG
jgi:hypothetical protein